MNCFQKEIVINAKARGFNLVTDEVLNQLPELKNFSAGIFHLFIQHTSASLSINENADPGVRHDMESYFNRIVPENAPYFQHTTEGSDDMPAHIKTSILGNNITVPVTNGRLNMGIWQGIYLCEHRNHGGRRHLIATIMGERK
ncbi:MAG: secondary thiamine-phosphate synthase enzyme YjbQ [Syntrophomonadaceae bacterium]